MRALLLLAPIALLPALSGCSTAACTHGEFGDAECRVAAEHHYARLVTSTGVSLRFVEPTATELGDAAPLGLLAEDDGHVRARPATLMDFALVIDPGDQGAAEVTVSLENVAPDAILSLGPPGLEVDLPGPGVGLRREIVIPLSDERLVLRSRRDCPAVFRVLVAGDVQTNPVHFERVLESMHDEVADGAAVGQPVLGFALLGDLAEAPIESELLHVYDLLGKAPVPVSTVPGNHDVHGDEMALYNRIFGPGNYVQAVCSLKLALLDTGAGSLAASVQAGLPEMFARSDFDFLVGGAHYPAHEGRTGNGWGDEDAKNYLLAELARNDADLFVAGHYHSWEEFTGIPVGDRELDQIISGTAGAHQGNGVPRFGYTRLTFSGAGISSCLVEVAPPGQTDLGTGTQDGIRFCP